MILIIVRNVLALACLVASVLVAGGTIIMTEEGIDARRATALWLAAIYFLLVALLVRLL